LSGFENTGVVSRHDDLRETLRLVATFDYVLDQWFSSNQREGFAGEPRRAISGRNDSGNFHPPLVAATRGQCTRKASQVSLGTLAHSATGSTAEVHLGRTAGFGTGGTASLLCPIP